MEQVPRPTVDEVEKYLKQWDGLPNYVMQEKSLNKLFLKVMPENKSIDDILIKASTLNDFYSTNIYYIFAVALHIKELDIDERLKKGDASLVDDIAQNVIAGKKFYFYSFASKYCSHHQPLKYPIYDSYVEKVLMYFKKKDRFDNFKKDDLKNYCRYKEVLENFAKYYGIDKYNLKDLDRYLWQIGKEHFKKKY
jgi:hypothetical protein